MEVFEVIFASKWIAICREDAEKELQMLEESGGAGGPGADRSGERRANKEESERQMQRERAGFGEAVRGVRKQPGEREMARS